MSCLQVLLKRIAETIHDRRKRRCQILLGLIILVVLSPVAFPVSGNAGLTGINAPWEAADEDLVVSDWTVSDWTDSDSADSNSADADSLGNTDEMIRFHVVANSDTAEDQALKRAVRDAILRELAPILAEAATVEESRKLIRELSPNMESIAREVIDVWGADYEVRVEYGEFVFPTKSYGSIILPAGEYEALQILIGDAGGSNWWCMLFPALCFVDIEHATAVQVDGKPGIAIADQGTAPGAQVAVDTPNGQDAPDGQDTPNGQDGQDTSEERDTGGLPDTSDALASAEAGEQSVRFWFWEKIKLLLGI